MGKRKCNYSSSVTSQALFINFVPMEINCTEKELFIFKEVAHAAEQLQVEAYLIGGFVRDKIIGRDTKDADVVCVGDGIKLAKEVAKRFNPVPHVSVFKTYGTAHIKVASGGEVLDGAFDLEFVGARRESYTYHSRNPEVTPGTLEDDQLRRDFTMNALAISLNATNYGKLIDPVRGVDDLKRKIIKTPLDPLQTFSDDPLRMMRAIRFATQLNFSIESK